MPPGSDFVCTEAIRDALGNWVIYNVQRNGNIVASGKQYFQIGEFILAHPRKESSRSIATFSMVLATYHKEYYDDGKSLAAAT